MTCCKSFISIIAFIGILSCNSKTESVYDLSIDREVLVNIMVDLTIAESSLSNFSGANKDSIKDVYRLYIEEIYGLKMAEIDSTLEMLYTNPTLNMDIQKEVIDSLKVLEEKSRLIK